MWVYLPVPNRQSGTDLTTTVFEVGFLHGDEFRCIEQYDNKGDARKAVHYLNGGEY